MSNNNASSREESKKRHEQRQHLILMKREEEIIKIEQEKLKKGQLSSEEAQNLATRKKMFESQRRLHAIDEQRGVQSNYEMLGGRNDGYYDVNRYDELSKSKEDTTLDYKTTIKDDSNWNNEQLSGILNQNDVGYKNDKGEKVNTVDVFNKVNLILHKQSQLNGTNDAKKAEEESLTSAAYAHLSDADKIRILEQRREEAELGVLTEFERIQYKRRKLPAFLYREPLLEKIAKNQVLIIEGETGSGKTTQIMQYLYEAGYCDDNKVVACTQPRRVAATSVAARVAVEKGVKLGEEVGYNVRFDNCTSDKTRIKYLTDGMLLRELLTDPNLTQYSVIMIDEAHERTISTDILLGILKPLLAKRSDLKVLIASATINIEKFSTFFSNAPTFKIPGRTCNIDIYYTETPEPDYVEAAVMTVMQIHQSQPLNGDILVFLPGQEEIQNTNDVLVEKYTTMMKSTPKMPTLMICPIYANLPAEEQAKIFQATPSNTRKVVLATNIAETSLTIDGIVYVIDCGWCKTKLSNSSSSGSGIGMEALVTTPVSKASANQRSGRAGRIRDGKCFRLFTYESYLELDDQNIPEIQRSNLCNVILLLKSLGINRFVDFDWIDPPSVQSLNQSLSLLYALGAIAPDGRLTQVGFKMTILPVDPMMAKMLIKSQMFKCTHDCIKIAAVLSVGGSILTVPNNKNALLLRQANKAHSMFYHQLGDHFTLLNVYNSYCEQVKYQSKIQKEIEDSLILYPSLQKQNELNKIKKYLITWCNDNYLQFKMLQRVDDIVKQLEKVCNDVGIPVKEFQDEHDAKMAKFGGPNVIDTSLSSNADLVAPQLTTAQEVERAAYLNDYEKRVRLSFLHGFFPNLAKLTNGGSQSFQSGGQNGQNGQNNQNNQNNQTQPHYALLKNMSQSVHIHPQSCLYRPSGKELRDRQRREANAIAAADPTGESAQNKSNFDLSKEELLKNGPPPQFVLFHELMQTKKEYLRGCMVVERDWIGVVAPHFYPDEARVIMQQQQQQKKR